MSLKLTERRIKIRDDKDLKADNLERMIQDSDDNFRKIKDHIDNPEIVQITSDWRIKISDAGDFVVEKKESGAWVEKLGVVP